MNDEFKRLAAYAEAGNHGAAGDPRRFMPKGWDGVEGGTKHGKVWMEGPAWDVAVGDIVAGSGLVVTGSRGTYFDAELGVTRLKVIWRIVTGETVTQDGTNLVKFFGPPDRGLHAEEAYREVMGLVPTRVT